MFSSPELTMLVATEYQRARVAEADKYRLLSLARRNRRSNRASQQATNHEARAGTLAACAPAAG